MNIENIEQEFQLAVYYHRSGNLQQSELLYKSILDKIMHDNLLTNFAALLSVQRRYDEAIRYIDKALEFNPSSLRASAQRERILYVAKRDDDAEVQANIKSVKSLLAEMNREVSRNDLYMPSSFWKKCCDLHEHLIFTYGVENCKRTVGHEYQNWFMTSTGDPQVKKLIELWPSYLNDQPLLNTINLPSDIGFHNEVHFPFYLLSNAEMADIYRFAVGLLWEYSLHNDDFGILENLSELPIGNPIEILRNGQHISSDLAHSVRERNTIMSFIGLSGNEHLTIAELGAGYGRLADVFGRTTNYRYIIFDIPPALYVSQWYISQVFPSEQIFKFRSFSDFHEIKPEFDNSRFAFFTPNQMELLPKEITDIFININSLMEMRKEQIGNYLYQIDRLTKGYFFSQQWYSWENPIDNIHVEQIDFRVDFGWSKVYEKTHEIYADFFVEIWEKSNAQIVPLPVTFGRINIILFPDWSVPEGTLGLVLKQVIRQLLHHPDRTHMAVLIYRGSLSEEEANLLLSGVLMEVLMEAEDELDVEAGPAISLVGSLKEAQWSNLLTQIHTRISLDCDDVATIVRLQAANLPLFDWA